MNSERLRVFIVEDEVIILESLRIFVVELGHELVGSAMDGEEALRLLQTVSPDLILMDINLPGLDGISTMNRIHEIRPTPCIFITGYSDSYVLEAASMSDAYGYLIKPVDKAALHAAINIAIKRYSEQVVTIEEARKAQAALQERKLIERAKGQIMEMTGMSEPQAMAFMQKRCRNNNLRLVDYARQVLKL